MQLDLSQQYFKVNASQVLTILLLFKAPATHLSARRLYGGHPDSRCLPSTCLCCHHLLQLFHAFSGCLLEVRSVLLKTKPPLFIMNN